MVNIGDIADYRFLSGISYSPDGKNAAFCVHHADMESNGYHSTVWLFDRGGKHRQLTKGGGEGGFAWLDDTHILAKGKPDGETAGKIAKGERWTVFDSVDISAGLAKRLLAIPLSVTDIKPLADGLYALTAPRDINRPELYTLDEAGKAAELASIEAEKGYTVLEEIPFCQNGVGYVSGIRSALYIFNAATGALTAVSSLCADVNGFEVKNGKLLYAAVEYRDIRTMSQGLHLYDPQSGGSEAIVPQGRYVFQYFDFLDDGYIFIGWENEKYEYCNNSAVYRVSANAVTLVCDPDISFTNSVSSDVRYGAERGQRVRDNTLYTVTTEVTRSVIRKVTPDGGMELVNTADGSVDDFDGNGDEILFIGQRGLGLQELYLLQDGIETQVSAFNGGKLDEASLGDLEHMEFHNNGFDVHYLVLKPIDFDPAKRYPAVFYIHGGAKVIFGPVFHHEMQVLSSQGYFVIYGDPRGSDGRGNEFARLKGHYGEKDYDDMMKALDTALERYPQIDSGRVACVGGSYGGLMTNLIITRTHRFKCAIAQRSISNLISNFSATDNGINFVANQMEATPWENYDGLWNVSPLKYADKVRTPLLLIHSELDFRCHYIEAIQMFNALKFHGVDSRVVLIAGENHSLSRSGRPKQRIRRLNEIVSWLNKYLAQ
ncbi:peptidase S9 [Clostridia bacterium]|nr:peptidase S9 [Clostridia bacterium]